jgi:hypothetical protein
VTTAPGWYPDPAVPGVNRWWDGQAWSGYAQPAGYVALLPDPARDLSEETKSARLAIFALRATAAVYALELLVLAVVVHRFFDAFRRNIRILQDDPSAKISPLAGLGRGYYALFGLLQILGLVALVAQVLFVIWAYRAATFAQRAGLPARHAPVWAVIGFLIPVVNLWFPYTSVADTLPLGHPGRASVGWWWGLTLAQGLASGAVLAAAAFSTLAGVIVAIVVAVVPAAAAYYGTRVVGTVSQVHAGLVP